MEMNVLVVFVVFKILPKMKQRLYQWETLKNAGK